jgi:hypothetical protein
MKIGIMQPYFFPYIGYFQLINAVDEFIIYDNIEFSKKGWINRNRILVNGKDDYVTVPLKKASDFLDIVNRQLSESWAIDRIKLLNRIKEAYRKAPMFAEVFPMLEDALPSKSDNLFDFLDRTLRETLKHLNIKTPIIRSSEIKIDHSLRAQQKVITLCKSRNSKIYINPIGGVELYNKKRFLENGLELYFLKANQIMYAQFENQFVPNLSIIDVLMFNSKAVVKEFLTEYSLL